MVDWFKKLKNKKNLVFIQFDVVNYYPSITSELLKKALNWAKEIVEITAEEIEVIIETKKSLLIMNGEAWTKKGDQNFDVAQGAFDSAEVCDLVGLFLLSEIKKEKLNANLGIYRDDGLGVSSATPRQVDKIKKKICEIYRKQGLSLTVENVNKKVVQFLDVELDLEKDRFKPYIKENDVPLYVHSNSNHPPTIIKNIPASINKRLSALSSDEEMFMSVAPKYQEALDKAGYKYKLKYNPESATDKPKKQNRKRNILWFNPPYCSTVKTNVGGKFLKLINKHFPRSNPLHKVINRMNTKVSYRTTSNMKQIISSHNKKLLRKSENPKIKKCNCTKEPCPIEGKCQTENVVYQATIQSENDEQTYVGLTSTSFKVRWSNHKTAFKHEKHRNDTTLAQHIWELQESDLNYTITWKFLGRAKPFSPVSGVCNLCTLEKWHILFTPNLAKLNKKRRNRELLPA